MSPIWVLFAFLNRFNTTNHYYGKEEQEDRIGVEDIPKLSSKTIIVVGTLRENIKGKNVKANSFARGKDRIERKQERG